MKVLLIGYGSIGQRHDAVLSQISMVTTIDLVTKREVENRVCYKHIEDVENLDQYSYFVVASETNKHYSQLKYLENKVQRKVIFCEKPLFEKNRDLKIEKNTIVIGYVLRFHPLLQKMREYTRNEKIISAHVKCGQYLPTWRKNIDYRDSYSAKKAEGGGVLLDLSHEIDYVQWLCGNIKLLNSYQVKISDLEIDSDDLAMLIGQTEEGTFVNISLDYISKIHHRRLFVETFEHSYELDFILNKLTKKNKREIEEIHTFTNMDRNYLFEKMHLDILNNQQHICTFHEAQNVMKTITTIQEQNV